MTNTGQGRYLQLQEDRTARSNYYGAQYKSTRAKLKIAVERQRSTVCTLCMCDWGVDASGTLVLGPHPGVGGGRWSAPRLSSHGFHDWAFPHCHRVHRGPSAPAVRCHEGRCRGPLRQAFDPRVPMVPSIESASLGHCFAQDGSPPVTDPTVGGR